jgi:hypothetical protein
MFVKDTAVTITWTIDREDSVTEADYDLLVTDPSGNAAYDDTGTWSDTFVAPVSGVSEGSLAWSTTTDLDEAGVWTLNITRGTGGAYVILSTSLIMVVDTDITHAITIPV